MGLLNHEILSSTETPEELLEVLANEGHSAAKFLMESWLIDRFLQGHLSAKEAALIGGISSDEFHGWLQQRHLSPRLDSPRSKNNLKHFHSRRPELSIVLPIYNEEQNIPELYRRLTAVLGQLCDYEIIFVNDGSVDTSSMLVHQFGETDTHVRLVEFSRNFGHQAAVTAGMDYSRGQAVVLMDADLQDPPELLVEMVAKWREGFEVVYAVRQKRKENLFKRTAYYWFYRILSALADIEIPLDSGDFCLMDRIVVEQMKRLPERNRFLRGLRSWVGFRQTPLPYERHARNAGTPKYSLRKLIKLALDGIFSFSSFPLRVAAYIGFFTSVAGITYLGFALFSRLVSGSVPPGWTSIVALMLIIGGTQLVLLGVLGEYVARIYEESKQRPSYVVVEPKSPGLNG